MKKFIKFPLVACVILLEILVVVICYSLTILGFRNTSQRFLDWSYNKFPNTEWYF
jgi:hypothetical protein